jgi:hypothetical protein
MITEAINTNYTNNSVDLENSVNNTGLEISEGSLDIRVGKRQSKRITKLEIIQNHLTQIFLGSQYSRYPKLSCLFLIIFVITLALSTWFYVTDHEFIEMDELGNTSGEYVGTNTLQQVIKFDNTSLGLIWSYNSCNTMFCSGGNPQICDRILFNFPSLKGLYWLQAGVLSNTTCVYYLEYLDGNIRIQYTTTYVCELKNPAYVLKLSLGDIPVLDRYEFYMNDSRNLINEEVITGGKAIQRAVIDKELLSASQSLERSFMINMQMICSKLNKQIETSSIFKIKQKMTRPWLEVLSLSTMITSLLFYIIDKTFNLVV